MQKTHLHGYKHKGSKAIANFKVCFHSKILLHHQREEKNKQNRKKTLNQNTKLPAIFPSEALKSL